MNGNKMFGMLSIIGEDKDRRGYVICRCDCGTVKSIRKTSLTKTKRPTRSCGCLQRKAMTTVGKNTIAGNSARQINENVRYNTNFQVIMNKKLPRNNSSGYKGVFYNKQKGRYEAYIFLHGKKIYLGRHTKIKDAIKARQTAEKQYFSPLIEEVQNEREHNSN